MNEYKYYDCPPVPGEKIINLVAFLLLTIAGRLLFKDPASAFIVFVLAYLHLGFHYTYRRKQGTLKISTRDNTIQLIENQRVCFTVTQEQLHIGSYRVGLEQMLVLGKVPVNNRREVRKAIRNHEAICFPNIKKIREDFPDLLGK